MQEDNQNIQPPTDIDQAEPKRTSWVLRYGIIILVALLVWGTSIYHSIKEDDELEARRQEIEHIHQTKTMRRDIESVTRNIPIEYTNVPVFNINDSTTSNND